MLEWQQLHFLHHAKIWKQNKTQRRAINRKCKCVSTIFKQKPLEKGWAEIRHASLFPCLCEKNQTKKIHILCEVKKSLFSLKHLLKKYSKITKLNSIPVSKTLPSPFRITQLHPRSFLSPFLSGESWMSNLQLGEVTRYWTYVFSCFSPWKLEYRYVL